MGEPETVHELVSTDRLGLGDEWLGVDVALEFSRPSSIWTFPIQTISQSESGFELNYQSSAVIPRWVILDPADGRFEVAINLVIDTSAAQARRLSVAAISGSNR